MSAALEVQRIGHSFRGLRVLRQVTFDVPAGSITGLIGPNGAGKSTLFNIVSGFLRADEGEVRYDGRPISKVGIEARSRLGLVRTFQTPQVFPHLTVAENLIAGYHKLAKGGVLAGLLALPVARASVAAAEARAKATAAAFGLSDLLDQLAGKLPAGQQRLLELARATIAQPRLLCLDEPSSGLNTSEVEDLIALLRRLNGQGITILLVSHDMKLMTVASTVNVLCFGEIIASGSFDEIKASQKVREAYLGI